MRYALFVTKQFNNGGIGMKKMLFIYNPNAGKGLLKAKLSDVLDIMVKAGFSACFFCGGG